MTLADRIAYLMTLLALPLVFWFLWQPATSQALQADIFLNGNYQQRVSLQQDRVLRIHGELGDSILEIQDGKIRFLDSPCRIKRCVHSGWLKHGGDFTACVPNKVSISLPGSADQQFDSINF